MYFVYIFVKYISHSMKLKRCFLIINMTEGSSFENSTKYVLKEEINSTK